MLEGLDTIDWANLQGGLGSAANVPLALRALVDADASVREDAVHDLYEAMEYEDVLYPATLLIIPFLLGLLAIPPVPDKRPILRLLFFVNEWITDPSLPSDMPNPPDTETPARSFLDAAILHQALSAGIDTYLNLLKRDPDPLVRAECAQLLATFPDHAPNIVPHLQHQVAREGHAEVKATVIQALDLLQRDHTADVALFLPITRTSDSLLVRFYAATAVVWRLGETTSDETLSVFIEGLCHPDVAQPSRFLIADARSVFQWGCRAIYRLGPLRGVETLFTIARCTTVIPYLCALTEAICDLTFPGQKRDVDPPTWGRDAAGVYGRMYDLPTASDGLAGMVLTPFQQQVVAALVAEENLWHHRDNIYAVYGLLSSRESLVAITKNDI